MVHDAQPMTETTARSSNAMAPGATFALVWGILGTFFCGVISGWVAINYARTAAAHIDRDPSLGGLGIAKAGAALGVFDILLWCGLLAWHLAMGVDA